MDDMEKLKKQVLTDMRRTLVWIIIAMGIAVGLFTIL